MSDKVKVRISVTEELVYSATIEMTQKQYDYAVSIEGTENDLGEFLLDFIDRSFPSRTSIQCVDEFDKLD